MDAAARFVDRTDAGRRLAEALKPLGLDDPLILALPRGGVPVAHEIAQALDAPLDVMLVRKIGAPGQAEYALGAIADGTTQQVILNDEAIAIVGPDPRYLEAEIARQRQELERRRKAYRGNRPPAEVNGRTIVLVDDGIATGSTAKAALTALRQAGAANIVLAIPVAPQATIAELAPLTDRIVCLATPEPFRAVGLHYADFSQTTDDEVVRLLAR